MKKDCCGNCVHLLKHYVILGNRLSVVNCGHCIFPRIKSRKSQSPACAHFTRVLLLEDGKPFRHRGWKSSNNTPPAPFSPQLRGLYR